jgi:hypothetical protein
MGNDSFEHKLEQEMMGLRIKPSEAVWQQVENRIQQERKRRIILWWIFSSCILIAGTGVWISEEKSTRDEQKTTQNNSESNIAVTSSNKKSSISEEFSNPYTSNPTSKETQHHLYSRSSKMLPKRKEQDKIYQEEFDAEPSLTPYSLQNMVTDHLSKSILPPNSDIIKKLNEKIKDTIIVVICNNNPPTNPSLEKEMKKPERQLNFNGFLSFHGTGDLSGTNLEFGIERKWGKRYGFYNNLGITIHSGQEAGFGLNSFPLRVNSTYKSLQTVTAGIQTMPTFYRYSKRGDLKIGAGLVGRYQMTSSGMYAVRGMGPGTNQYSYNIYEVDPNTFSLGYRISADLLLIETKKNKLGFQLYFQNDTRGDALTGLGLSFQTKYKK